MVLRKHFLTSSLVVLLFGRDDRRDHDVAEEHLFGPSTAPVRVEGYSFKTLAPFALTR